MVTKRSVNGAELCQTNPRRDLLTEPGQHNSVRLFGECKHFYNRANCFQNDERAANGRVKFSIVSRRVLRVSYERFLLQRFEGQRVDRYAVKCTASLTSGLMKRFRLSWNQLNETSLFSKESLKK